MPNWLWNQKAVWQTAGTSGFSVWFQFHNLQDLRHSAPLVTKVFIQRDYSEGTVCRFLTKFPSELDNRVRTHTLADTGEEARQKTVLFAFFPDMCFCPQVD